jgi:chemotaxis signal transduction protein
VVNWQDWIFAMQVDEAAGVEEIDSDLTSHSPTSSDLMKRCATGVVLHRGRAVTCLAADQLMQELEGALQ